MKKITYLLLTLLAVSLFSCNEYYDYEYGVNEPVLMSAEAFRANTKVGQPQTIDQQGKICFYNDYLYISDPQKGIHIIDNKDPKSPRNIGYIELPGNADLSIRNDLLYADALIDLVWFDISNPAKPEQKGRLENAFPNVLPVCDNQYSWQIGNEVDLTNNIVVGWRVVMKKERVKVSGDSDMAFENNSLANTSGSNVGKTGSMSRFAIYKDYLYAIINNQLHIFDLKGEMPKTSAEPNYISWDVETIFSYKECMFFGTRNGMIIYSVADPLNPVYESMMNHVYGCDPVVVENDLAYVTVWSGNACGQNTNELFIVDVSDIKNPKQIVSYSMKQPKGLGIDNGTLFVCDDGLKVFDAADPQTIMSNVLAHYKGMDGYDVIPWNNTLMMIADDGLYQYDYSNLKDIKLLSKLSINKK